MSRKLYVGNLSFNATEEYLTNFFSTVGNVTDVKIIKDADTLKPRGFAFIEMDTEEAAKQAIAEFNGRSFMERDLNVNEAREPEKKPWSNEKKSYESVYTGGKKLYIGNLPYTTIDSDIIDIFSEVGNVVSVKVITDVETGRSKGFCFVEMDKPEEAKAAVEKLNGKEIKGRKINVNSAKERERK